MSIATTAAATSLFARLEAAGQPLDIDTYIFAYIPNLDPTAPIDMGAGVPWEHVVYQCEIAPEHRAYVNPNQVVYSAILGSDIGPFKYNWQGIYSSEHDTLIRVATFPAIPKNRYDPATNTAGNNHVRNMIVSHLGVQELTNINISAAVWQIDFTTRLKGIDERERLSNLDIYGHDAFLDDGWLLVGPAELPEGENESPGVYTFTPGVGYAGGIRSALDEPLQVTPSVLPCKVYLDVSMYPQGSDVITVVEPQFVDETDDLTDYQGGAPLNSNHYVALVAHIDADGKVTDKRRAPSGGLPMPVDAGEDSYMGLDEDGKPTWKEIELAAPERNGLAPKGGRVGQFYGASKAYDEETGEEREIYEFKDLPASVTPLSDFLPRGDENGKLDTDWLKTVSSIMPSTEAEDLPNVEAVRKYVERYMGDHPPNVERWITASGNFVATANATINVILVGGGGNGGSWPVALGYAGAGGGGSGQILSFSLTVVKGTSYPIVIGGARGASSAFERTALPGNSGGNPVGGKTPGAGGSGTSGGGGGVTTTAYGGAGGSIWLGGYGGGAGYANSSNPYGGAGGSSANIFDYQKAVSGGAGNYWTAGGGSTGIVTSSGTMISAGSGSGNTPGAGGKGYGAGGGGAGRASSGSATSPGGAGAPGVCIIYYYDPELAEE